MKNSICLMLFAILLVGCSGSESSYVETGDTSKQVLDTAASANAFEDFTYYVSQLDPIPEYVDSALQKFHAVKVSFTQEEKDSSFFVIKKFMESFQISDEEIGDLSEERQNEIEKKYTKLGFQVWWEEGYPYPMPDIKFLEKEFKKDISVDLDNYLDVLKKTFAQTTSDAGLSISWSELSDRIISCEDFMIENQDSKYFQNVLNEYSEHLRFIMWGLDNTPIAYQYEMDAPNQLDPDLEGVYQKLIKDNKHKTGKIIADHLTWLESKNFTFSYEDMTYLSDAYILSYLGLN